MGTGGEIELQVYSPFVSSPFWGGAVLDCRDVEVPWDLIRQLASVDLRCNCSEIKEI